jgi:hypothetical protein
MENRQRREPFPVAFLSLLPLYRTSCTLCYFCSPQPNARAERVSERGSSIYSVWHFLLTRLSLFLHLLYVASMSCVSAMLHFKPVYTPLALRDWFRAAPRNPLKATDAPAACPTPRRPGKNFPPVPTLSGDRFVRKTEQDAHHVGDRGRAPPAARTLRR